MSGDHNMNQKPTALRLADELTNCVHAGVGGPDLQAAAELRRLHELHELYQDKTRRQQARITTLEAALRQAVGALEQSVGTCFDQWSHHEVMSRPEHFVNQALTAAKQALEGKT